MKELKANDLDQVSGGLTQDGKRAKHGLGASRESNGDHPNGFNATTVRCDVCHQDVTPTSKGTCPNCRAILVTGPGPVLPPQQ